MALMSWATHVLQWANRVHANREVEQIAKNRPQFGLESETRLHEGGIASNRASAWRGENDSRALYTPPVTPSEWGYPKPLDQPARGDDVEGTSREEGEVVTR